FYLRRERDESRRHGRADVAREGDLAGKEARAAASAVAARRGTAFLFGVRALVVTRRAAATAEVAAATATARAGVFARATGLARFRSVRRQPGGVTAAATLAFGSFETWQAVEPGRPALGAGGPFAREPAQVGAGTRVEESVDFRTRLVARRGTRVVAGHD